MILAQNVYSCVQGRRHPLKLCPFCLPINPKPQRANTKSVFSAVLVGIILLLLFDLSSPAAHAQSYSENPLYSFNPSNTTDGTDPNGCLCLVNGIFYGTTISGGNQSVTGTLFSYNPSTNVVTTLYSFTQIHGYTPTAGLTYDSGSRKLYGTTQASSSGNQGTIFSFDPSTNVLSFLYDFTGHADGYGPSTAMIDVNGTLYGTTFEGGSNLYGTVFSFNIATKSLKTLYSFSTSSSLADGVDPESDLTYDTASGKLFGTTSGGGDWNGEGTIFSLAPDGTSFQTVYTFGKTTQDGTYPDGGLTEVNGIIYGTTNRGGANNLGTIFELNPTTNTETILHSFQGASDGQYPTGDLTYDSTAGRLFGNAEQGGDAHSDGTVFSIKPDGTGYRTVYAFKGYPTDAGSPYRNSLLDVNGTFYGITGGGGGAYSQGAIYSLTPVSSPSASNDKYLLKYATPYAVHAPGVLANDNTGAGTLTATLVTNVTHGTLTLNADGSFSYTPSSGFVGTDTFTYKDTNSAGTSNTATVSLVVQAVVPVAHNDAYAPIYSHAYKVNAPGVLGNDYAGDTGSLTAKLVSTVSHGTLTLNSDGSFLYSPTFEYSGTDSFTYTATNAIGTSNTATVTITINPVVPIAHNDTYAPKYQTAYGVSAPGVLGNDDDGGTSPMTAALVSSVTHGTLTFNSNGSFTYTPAAGFVGTDSFTYQDTTPTGTGNTATVTLNVTAALPVAHNDSYALTHNKAFAVKAPGVLGNDYAGDSGSFTAALVSTTSHGILTFNTDGSFNYTPTTGFTGTDTFTYQAKNAIGTSNTATVTLTVQ